VVIILLLGRPRARSRACPAFYTLGTGSSFLGVKQQWHENDHSPPSGAEIKIEGAVSPFHIYFHGKVHN
jgi:hypothetical protein